MYYVSVFFFQVEGKIEITIEIIYGYKIIALNWFILVHYIRLFELWWAIQQFRMRLTAKYTPPIINSSNGIPRPMHAKMAINKLTRSDGALP